ncbi:MAG: hypothetical protein LBS82_03435, partial [Spirochaetaceae bacterium]|nr:hypothetical protein [Spirochaetaceae bacterium]
MKKNMRRHLPAAFGLILAVLVGCGVTVGDGAPQGGGGTTVTTYKVEEVGGKFNDDDALVNVTSTEIKFTFSAAPTGLTAEDFAVSGAAKANDTATLGGSGMVWTLPITVKNTGTATVQIFKNGVVADEQTVLVFKKDERVPPLLYSVGADGSPGAASTKITFTFRKSVDALTDADINKVFDEIALSANDITVTGAAAASGTLVQSTTDKMIWTLPVTVSGTGIAQVSINKTVTDDGITGPAVETGEKLVSVYKQGAYPVIADAVQVGGAAGTKDSTGITFVFSAAVTGLTANHVAITKGTGEAVKGAALAGSGLCWRIDLASVATQGEVTLRVVKDDIDSSKTVTVYKKGGAADIAYIATADGASGATTSTKISLAFNAALTDDLTEDDVTITKGTGEATKGAVTG